MPTALITGGSCGIGLELSKYFIKGGYNLLWVSATDSEIANGLAIINTNFPGALITAKTIDLTNAAQAVYDGVSSEVNQLDVLVNNAGFGTYGYVNDIDVQEELNMIQVNLVTPYTLTRLSKGSAWPINEI